MRGVLSKKKTGSNKQNPLVTLRCYMSYGFHQERENMIYELMIDDGLRKVKVNFQQTRQEHISMLYSIYAYIYI